MRIVKLETLGLVRGLLRMRAVVESDTEPPVNEVATLAGYHPAGYGCYDVSARESGPAWVVEWSRGSTCD
jgi:hypothetical protein